MNGELQLLGMVALAALLGGLIGFDREIADKPAGLRTHMLVAAAAALLVGLAPSLTRSLDVPESLVQSDPIRVMEAVITGVAFLGAGTIIREKAGVEGLTTAASLLFVAAVGMTVALSHYALAVALTLFNLLVLRGVKLVDEKLLSKVNNDESEAKPPPDQQTQAAKPPTVDQS